jgi:hypothetical protein
MIRRDAEGGAILSDAEQAAVVKMLAANAIHKFTECGWEDVPELAEGAWDAVADDMALLADALVLEADTIAVAAGFDAADLLDALNSGDLSDAEIDAMNEHEASRYPQATSTT